MRAVEARAGAHHEGDRRERSRDRIVEDGESAVLEAPRLAQAGAPPGPFSPLPGGGGGGGGAAAAGGGGGGRRRRGGGGGRGPGGRWARAPGRDARRWSRALSSASRRWRR